MKVIVNEHVYQMSRHQLKGLIKVAKGSIHNGIIAVEKDNIVEMRRDSFISNSEKKRRVKEFEDLGYKVYKS